MYQQLEEIKVTELNFWKTCLQFIVEKFTK